jgi:hypothetical protein
VSDRSGRVSTRVSFPRGRAVILVGAHRALPGARLVVGVGGCDPFSLARSTPVLGGVLSG